MAETLQAKDLKIQALILELAHLRRFAMALRMKHCPVYNGIYSRKPAPKTLRRFMAEVEQADEQAGSTVTNPSARARAVTLATASAAP